MPKAALSNGLVFHYERTGFGPPLVMIHGISGNLAVWHLKIVPYLWDEFEVVTYDLRGHGYSQMPPTGYTVGDMADDLRQLFDALEIESAPVVGHSYGADIALYFAHMCPERVTQVVAIEAALPALTHLRARKDWSGWTYWEEALERSGAPVPSERRRDMDYLLRQTMDVPKQWGPLKGLPRNTKPFLRLLEQTTLPEDYVTIGELTLENIDRIQTPVTLIYDERSSFIETCQYLQGHLPSVQTLMLPHSELGHFGPMEQPDILAQHLLDVLVPKRAAAATQARD